MNSTSLNSLIRLVVRLAVMEATAGYFSATRNEPSARARSRSFQPSPSGMPSRISP